MGKALSKDGGTESERSHSARLVRLDQHVRTGKQIEQLLAIARGVEIECQSELVRVAKGEVQAAAVRVEGRKTSGTSAARRLDTHDFSAEVAQDSTGELALLVGQIDDA